MEFDRRQFLRTVSLGAGAIALHGCGSDDDGDTANSAPDTTGGGGGSTTPATTGGGTTPATTGSGTTPATTGGSAPSDYVPSGTVTMWVHEASANAVLESLFEEYKAANPGVEIELLAIPYAEFETKALTSTSAGDGPDILKISGWSLPDWADKGLLREVTPDLLGVSSPEEIVAAYGEGALGSVSFDGKPFALPVDYQNLMLFYRPDHFEEVGLDPASPPTTWEQVLEYGAQLTKGAGNDLERAGFTWWYFPPIWVYLEMLTLVSQLGGSILNEDATAGNLSTAEGVRAVDYYIGMAAEHGITTMDLATSVHDRVRNGAASMFISGSFTGPVFGAGDPTLTPENGSLAVAPIPQWADATNDVTAAYAWGWAVTSNADDPQLAGHLASFLGSRKESADRLFVEGGLATPYAGFADSPAATSTPWNEVLVSQIPQSVYGPRTAQFARMMDDLAGGLQAGSLGEKSAEQVAEEFDRSMERVLR